jgi:hypothetical protein
VPNVPPKSQSPHLFLITKNPNTLKTHKTEKEKYAIVTMSLASHGTEKIVLGKVEKRKKKLGVYFTGSYF